MKTITYHGAILVVENNTVSFYPVGVEAANPLEAEGKLLYVGRKSFPGARIEVKVNTHSSPVITDPKTAGFTKQE